MNARRSATQWLAGVKPAKWLSFRVKRTAKWLLGIDKLQFLDWGASRIKHTESEEKKAWHVKYNSGTNHITVPWMSRRKKVLLDCTSAHYSNSISVKFLGSSEPMECGDMKWKINCKAQNSFLIGVNDASNFLPTIILINLALFPLQCADDENVSIWLFWDKIQ